MSVRGLASIAPYLPLQDFEGRLRWVRSTEYALKAVIRGPDTSKVDSAMALYDFIEDLRNENGDLKPISPQVAVGLSRLCDEMEDAEDFFTSTLPYIAELALELPDLLEHHEMEISKLSDRVGVPLKLRVLAPQQSGMILLHQHLIAALLACAFLCLYPQARQQLQQGRMLGLHDINFDGLYLGVSKSSNVQKLRCIVHYFQKVAKNMPEGTVSFERRVLPLMEFGHTPSRGSFWSNSKKPLCEMKIVNVGSLTAAGSDYLQIDFANEQLGGGALHTGCVQEEIRFMVCPECIAGMLFLPTMSDNESIEIIGVETYSESSGYGSGFRFAGDHTDTTLRDSWGRRRTCVGAIDALCRPGESQFEDDFMLRELTKAYCGFLNHSSLCGYDRAPASGSSKSTGVGLSPNLQAMRASGDSKKSVPGYDSNYEVRSDRDSGDDSFTFMVTDEDTSDYRSRDAESTGNTCAMHQTLKGVATGNWGAGAFGGNLQLKSLLQWLSASQAGCTTMLYYSFGDPRSKRLEEVVDWIQKEGWCVSELWSLVQDYGRCRLNRQVKSELYEWILPHDGKELFILRSKTVRFKSSAEQLEREDFLMLTTHPGRRQLTREVAPRMKSMGCWSWPRTKRK